MKRWRLSLRGLRVQILLWVILPFILLLIAFSLTGIRSHQESMRALVAERDLGLARALAQDVANTLDRYRIALTFLSKSIEETSPNEMLAHLKQGAVELDVPFSFAIVDARGRLHISDENKIGRMLLEKASMKTDLPQLIQEGTTPFLLWQIPRRSGGYIVAWMPLSALRLSTTLRAGYSGQMGVVCLLDERGHLLATSGKPLVDEKLALPLQEITRKASGVIFTPSSQGELVIAHARVPVTGWHVVIQEPWEALVAPLLHFDRVMPFILLAATVISLFALFFGLRYVVAPLQRLREQAERIGLGDFWAARTPVGGVQEIEDLRETLDRMARQVARYQAALQVYLKMLTRIQEEERSRLGRELHDSTVQTLIALSQRLQMLERELRRDPEQARLRVAALRQMVSEAIEDVRRFSRALRPVYLEELGLVPALEMLAREAEATFQMIGAPVRLSPEVELALFRIAQEALSNAQRHARARHVAVVLTFDKDQVRLAIQDDGEGFKVPDHLTNLVHEGHLGLMSMRERAEIIGGKLVIRSQPGRGTRVEVLVPISRPSNQ